MASRKRDVNDIKLRASHKKTTPAKRRTSPTAQKAKLPVALPHRKPSTATTPVEAPAPIRIVRLERVEVESKASDSARRLAIDIAAAAIEKKAVGLEVLDVSGRVDYADFLVLMSGRSDRQVVALAEGIEEALRRSGRRPINIEGRQAGLWVLMDFGDVVVHVFQEQVRSMYDIEGLWEEARRLPMHNSEES